MSCSCSASVSFSFEVEGGVAIVEDDLAVGDEDDGARFVGEEILKQFFFGLTVEGASGLVENHKRTLAQQGTRYADALGLTLTESPTLLGE